jgi:hypothetical protein
MSRACGVRFVNRLKRRRRGCVEAQAAALTATPIEFARILVSGVASRRIPLFNRRPTSCKESIMRKTRLLLFAAALGLSATATVRAAEMYPWREHQRPFTFVFGNEIDGHQQTRQGSDGGLDGYLYVQYTGVVTQDNLPVATHANCSAAGVDCVVGWKVDGKPSSAKLVREPMHDHPVFLIGRPDIPQPGAYVHFHWTGMGMPMPYVSVPGYLLQLTAFNRFCFIHHGAEAATDAKSCRDNGGVKVERGLDTATHLNIITSDLGGM